MYFILIINQPNGYLFSLNNHDNDNSNKKFIENKHKYTMICYSIHTIFDEKYLWVDWVDYYSRVIDNDFVFYIHVLIHQEKKLKKIQKCIKIYECM